MHTLIINPQARLQIDRFPSAFDRVCIRFPHTCHMSRPSHSTSLENPTNIWQKVRMVKFPPILHSIMCIRKAIRTGLLKTREEKKKKGKRQEERKKGSKPAPSCNDPPVYLLEEIQAVITALNTENQLVFSPNAQ